jgi:hypothetical protein
MRCEVDPPGFLVLSCYGRLPRADPINKQKSNRRVARNTGNSAGLVQTQELMTRTHDDDVERLGNMFSLTSN